MTNHPNDCSAATTDAYSNEKIAERMMQTFIVTGDRWFKIAAERLRHPAQAVGMREALENLEAWCEQQRYSIGSVDGYDYRSGEEFGIRSVEIEISKRLKALAAQPPAAPVETDRLLQQAAIASGTVVQDLPRARCSAGNVEVPTDALINLVNYQEQCDEDGVMVKVSRQALAEVLVYVQLVRPDLNGEPQEAPETTAALERARSLLRRLLKDKRLGVEYAEANQICHEITAALTRPHRAPG